MSDLSTSYTILLRIFPLIISTIIFLFFYKIKIINFFSSIENFLKKNNYLNIFILICVLSFVFTAEEWIFWKSSFFSIYDSGENFFPWGKRIAEQSIGSIAHDVAGGVYKPAFLYTDTFINLNFILLKIFGPFFGNLILRFISIFVGLIGGYVLIYSLYKNSIISILASGIIIHSYHYVVTSSFVHGLGYVSLPLTVYLCFFLKTKFLYKFFIFILYAFILSTTSTLPHSILPQIIAIASFWILLLQDNLDNKYINLLQALLFSLLIITFSFINNFSWINYILASGDNLARNFYSNFFHGDIQSSFRAIISKFTYGIIWLPTIIVFFLYNLYKKRIFLSIGLLAPFIFIFLANQLSKIEIFSLFSAIKFDDWLYALPLIIVFVGINIIRRDINFISILKYQILEHKVVFYFLFFIFFSFFFYYKYVHSIAWISDGSYKSNYEFNTLQKKFLIDEKILFDEKNLISNFRTVMVPTRSTPGFLLFNQIPSFDGYSTFFNKDRVLEWVDATNENRSGISGGELFVTKRKALRCFKKVNNLLDHIDLDFLSKHSVKYIFSIVPLDDVKLNEVLKPHKSFNCSNFYEEKKLQLKQNFKKAEFYIYENKFAKPIFNFKPKLNSLKQVPSLCLGSPKKIILNNDSWELQLNNCQKKFIKNIYLEFSLPNFIEVEIKDMENKIKIKQKKEEDMLFHFVNIGKSFKDGIVISPKKIDNKIFIKK